MDVLPAEPISVEGYAGSQPLVPINSAVTRKTSKAAVRTSLKASTVDGVFATVFSNVAGGVLLSNFLVELDATAIEVGMLASIPMLANLLQPIGAYLSERTSSRHFYCLWIYGPSRLLWLILVLGIALATWGNADTQGLVPWTLGIVFASHFLGALGSASWLSWLAALVPRRLRGRYFGIRNSAASLTNLVSVPLLGWIVSAWAGGTLQGYGVVLLLGIVAGIVSLGFQYFMVDVNPQEQHAASSKDATIAAPEGVIEDEAANNETTHGATNNGAANGAANGTTDRDPLENSAADNGTEPCASQLQSPEDWHKMLKDANFLRFLLYLCLWMFAVNLSAPFFNLYLLGDLALDIRWVTIYNSLGAGANLLMLIVWGRIADRVGNRPILILVGILVAITPILWLGTRADAISIWLWFPLLHILSGATWAAIDLCTNNLQIGVAPIRYQASYFAIAAAVAGVSGALGTTAGGLLTQFTAAGGLLGLFALSSVVRLVALLPLVFVREEGGRSLQQILRALLPSSEAQES